MIPAFGCSKSRNTSRTTRRQAYNYLFLSYICIMRDVKKEYDRKRAEKVYKEFVLRRENVLIKLGGECYLCGKKAVKGFHLHHKEYHPIESNYPRHSKSMYVRLKRLSEAENNPERFALLCPYHHKLIENIKHSNIDKYRFNELLKS